MGKRKKKRRGHYCKICGSVRPNEKFSGKGHRQHICKSCKGKKNNTSISSQQQSEYDRHLNQLNKEIKNGMILYTKYATFFLFEYQRKRYITRDDFESEIFLYQKKNNRFVIDESMPVSEALINVLYKKLYEAIDASQTVSYEHLEYDITEISQRRMKYLEVIQSMRNLTM